VLGLRTKMEVGAGGQWKLVEYWEDGLGSEEAIGTSKKQRGDRVALFFNGIQGHYHCYINRYTQTPSLRPAFLVQPDPTQNK
jgi:hypothetical protein